MNKIFKHKFAILMLAYDVSPFILKAIDNTAPYVEKIYISYSKYPWKYNKKAKYKFINPTPLDLIYKSSWIKKCSIINGEWDYEEDQRNICINQAKQDDVDFLIIQDADEFYFKNDFLSNLNYIDKNSQYDLYKTPWYSFWKNTSLIISTNNNKIQGYPEFAINIKNNIYFTKGRKTNALKIYVLDKICYHLSSVRNDEDMFRKISTWGHSHQFNRYTWYLFKWLFWDINKKNLHPITPKAWQKIELYNETLPEVINNFKYGSFSYNNSYTSKLKIIVKFIKLLVKDKILG